MKEEKEYLLELIDKKELSFLEKKWLLNYIEHTDQQSLISILEEQFINDLNYSNVVNPEKSAKLLTGIHKKIHLPES